MKDKEEIVFTKYSPYMVVGMEKIKDEDGKEYKMENVTSLCRCGKSKHSPYCDGSHSKEHFSGEKEEKRAENKLKNYIGKNIIIHFNLGICAHVGICIKELPSVFSLRKRPWINADGAEVEKIIEIIKKCPSGALTYTIDDKRYTEWNEKSELILKKDGPIEVRGGVKLKDDMNSEKELESKEHYCLCSCGNSKNKPFCDGTHRCKDKLNKK